MKIKDKEKSWKNLEGCDIVPIQISMQIIMDFSFKVMEARRKWHSIFQVLKEKDCQTQILKPVNLSLRNEKEVKILWGRKAII